METKSIKGKIAAAFALTEPNELRMLKKSRDADERVSLILPFAVRFPSFPEWPLYPEALKEHACQAHAQKLFDQLKQTDAPFHRLFLEATRDLDKEHRVVVRRGVEDDAVYKHAEAWVTNELLRRAEFARKAKAIASRATNLLQRTRLLQLAYFEFARERSYRLAEIWKDARLKEAVAGFAERQARWDLRVENLYQPTDLGGVAKTPGSGRPIEYLLGQIYNDVCRVTTKEFNRWHLEDRRIAKANGGMERVGPLGRGQPVEVVIASLALPELRARTSEFIQWRATAFLIMTANDSFQHAFRQGRLPEAAYAARALPIVDARTALHQRVYESHRWVASESGAVVRLAVIGQDPETVRAAVELPVKEEATRKLDEARQRHRYVLTANGGYGQLAEVGRPMEHVVDNIDRPKRAEQSAAFTAWHNSHLFGPTENGGWGPLDDIGHTLEGVTAARHAGISDVRTDNFEARAEHRHEVTDFLFDLRAQHRFVPTANDGWARLPSFGRALEQVVADLKATKKDEADPRQGTVQSRPDITPLSPHAAPLPSGGNVLAEAKEEQVQLRNPEPPPSRGLNAFKRNIAAHAARLEASRLQGHALGNPVDKPEDKEVDAPKEDRGAPTAARGVDAGDRAAPEQVDPTPQPAKTRRSA